MRWDIAIDTHVGRGGVRSDDNAPFHLDIAFQSDAARLVLFGPSGAGKSLTMMTIAGLLRPDHGHVMFDGEALSDERRFVPARARRLAYLFQDYALFPHLTVGQNVAFGLAHGWRNPPRRSDDERVRRWLHTLELDGLVDRYPEQLSGGQRQRTALARALVGEPRALLLDEPFAALDGPLRERLRGEVAVLCERLALPLILITHDAADVERFGEEVITIAHGRVVAEES